MSDRPWLKLWKKDYLGDIELRLCDPASRGLLVDYMCIADDGQPRGYITRRDGTAFTEQELADTCCKSDVGTYRKLHASLVDRHRIVLDPKLKRYFIPRAVKDAVKSEQAIQSGKKGGNPKLTSTSDIMKLPAELDTASMRRVWPKWITHLRDHGKKATADSLAMQLEKLIPFGSEMAVRMLEQSIASEWVCLFMPKNIMGGKVSSKRFSLKRIRDDALEEALKQAWPQYRAHGMRALGRLKRKWLDQYDQAFVDDVIALLKLRKTHQKD